MRPTPPGPGRETRPLPRAGEEFAEGPTSVADVNGEVVPSSTSKQRALTGLIFDWILTQADLNSPARGHRENPIRKQEKSSSRSTLTYGYTRKKRSKRETVKTYIVYGG